MVTFFKKFAYLIIFLLVVNNGIYSQIKLDNIYSIEDGISYSVVLPVNYNKNKKYQLAIGLHGLFSDGNRMVNPFSYYSRYMDIILVCPDGNFADNGRNGVKWGYEKSEGYILNLVELIKTKYRVYDEIFLFGFSQGGNQGLQTALSYPNIFRYFAALSGGYSSLTNKHYKNFSKINILFISGDTGDGEAFTKREMDNRFQILKRFNPYAIRKVFQGIRHEVTHEQAYYMFEWFLEVSRKNRSGHLVKTDYYKPYAQSYELLTGARYFESISYSNDCISKNPIFAPAYLNLSSAYFYTEDITNFKKIIFPTLVMYSNYNFFDNVPVLNLIETIKLSDIDFLQKNNFLDFFQTNIKNYENKLSTLYKGEMYLLLAELHLISRNTEYARASFKKALNYFEQVSPKQIIYIDADIKKKILYTSEYIKELEPASTP